MREAVLRDEETMRIQALVEEGLASGVCEDEPEAVIERIIAERRARHAMKART